MSIRLCLLILGLTMVFRAELVAQESISSIEKKVDATVGFERLELLSQLTIHYYNIDGRKARKYARQGNILADNILKSNTELDLENAILVLNSKQLYGEILYNRESYLDAQSVFRTTREVSLQFDYSPGEVNSKKYLDLIDSLIYHGEVKSNIFTRTLADIDIGSALSNSSNSMATSSELQLAKMAEKKGDTTAAIVHYRKASDLLRNRGQEMEAMAIDDKIDTYQQIRRIDSIRDLITNVPSSSTANGSVNRISVDSSGYVIVTKIDSAQLIKDNNELANLKRMAVKSEASNDFEASLNYYKQYVLLEQKYQKDSAMRITAIKLANSEMDRLEQENALADLNISAIQREKDAEVQLKNIIIYFAVLISIATVFILVMYLSKNKKHKELTTAYSDLDVANGRLEKAEKNISNLLKQQVSPEIASALIQDKPQREEQYVAVMFLDIRGFTPMAEKLSPEALIEYQNNVFGFMIEIIQERHGNINQFMGDGFMATFGAPVSHGNDSRNAYMAGLDILVEIKRRNEEKLIPHTVLGIGIHAGLVVTGNVGTETRKQYSVTGNTVIIAARVEQLNKVYGSQMIVTEEVFVHIGKKDHDIVPERHEVAVKGRKAPVDILIVSKEPVSEMT